MIDDWWFKDATLLISFVDCRMSSKKTRIIALMNINWWHLGWSSVLFECVSQLKAGPAILVFSSDWKKKIGPIIFRDAIFKFLLSWTLKTQNIGGTIWQMDRFKILSYSNCWGYPV